jgi:hypothetical protein
MVSTKLKVVDSGIEIKYVGWSVNACDLYLVGVQFESQPQHPLSWQDFVVFFSLARNSLGQYRKRNHGTTLHIPFKLSAIFDLFNAVYDEVLMYSHI